MIAIAVVIDFILLILVSIAYAMNGSGENDTFDVISALSKANGLGFGQSISMALVIPFVLLFSYTRTHKDTRIDMVIPIFGLVGLGIVYFEELFQIMTQYVIPQLSKIVQD